MDSIHKKEEEEREEIVLISDVAKVLGSTSIFPENGLIKLAQPQFAA